MKINNEVLTKSKIIAKVIEKVQMEQREDMEQIQDKVAEELTKATGIELEETKETVRFVIAEFIRDNK